MDLPFSSSRSQNKTEKNNNNKKVLSSFSGLRAEIVYIEVERDRSSGWEWVREQERTSKLLSDAPT